MKSIEECLAVKDRHLEKLMSYPGVFGVGIGHKTENGKETDELAILVYVEEAKTDEQRDALNSIPSEMDEVAIQIIETVPPTFQVLYITKENKDILNDDQGRYRPLVGGSQLYLHNDKYAWLGTLCTFVESQDASDTNLYLLSNRHVLESVGLAVFQPLQGNENNIAATSVAQVYPDADAAIAEVNDPSDASLNTIQGIGKVTQARSAVAADLGKHVIKRGRTTLLTEGTLEAINVDVNVSGYHYINCVLVRAEADKVYSAGGDSGSPVVLKDEYLLTGLHFAGNGAVGGIGVFCQIENVFNDLNIELPS